MFTIFLGDSFTSGENNNDNSFVDYYKGSTYNLGISGTTMGEYSIYPVDGNSLLSVIKRNTDILKKADTICLEYGINDTSAIMCGFTSGSTVLISFVKALDWLHQLNPNAKIYFLSLSNNNDIIHMFAEAQCKYLENEYFAEYDFNFPVTLWENTYKDLIDRIANKIVVVPMLETFNWDAMIDKDKLHPNNFGYRFIADTIKEYI